MEVVAQIKDPPLAHHPYVPTEPSDVWPFIRFLVAILVWAAPLCLFAFLLPGLTRWFSPGDFVALFVFLGLGLSIGAYLNVPQVVAMFPWSNCFKPLIICLTIAFCFSAITYIGGQLFRNYNVRFDEFWETGLLFPAYFVVVMTPAFLMQGIFGAHLEWPNRRSDGIRFSIWHIMSLTIAFAISLAMLKFSEPLRGGSESEGWITILIAGAIVFGLGCLAYGLLSVALIPKRVSTQLLVTGSLLAVLTLVTFGVILLILNFQSANIRSREFLQLLLVVFGSYLTLPIAAFALHFAQVRLIFRREKSQQAHNMTKADAAEAHWADID